VRDQLKIGYLKEVDEGGTLNLKTTTTRCTKCVIVAAGKGHRLQEMGSSKPLLSFLGLPIIERTIRTAMEAGIDDFLVVTGYKHEILQIFLKDLSEKTNVRINVIYNPEWETKSNGYSVLQSRGEIQEQFLLLMADHLFDSEIARELISQDNDSDVILATDSNTNNPLVDFEDVTKVKVENGRIISIGKGLDTYDSFDTGIFLCNTELFKALEECNQNDKTNLSDAIQYLADKGRVSTHDISGKFWADIDDKDAYKKASKAIINNLNKPNDGFIAKRINRPISIRISKILLNVNITPNQISLFAFGIACIASILFATGLLPALIAGGILAQLASIIDGCDGEIARLKFQKSEYGGWFDAVLDRYADAFLLFGLTWYLYLNNPSSLSLFIGFMAIIGSFMLSYTADKYDNLMASLINKSSFRIGRDTRIFIIMLGCLLNQVLLVLLILALIMNIETIKRIIICRTKVEILH
jgi:CDP-L-myo-inositol myo-inositolphosphotransferase